MLKIVGVRFKDVGKIYYFSPGELEITENQGVIVENAQGIEFGKTVIEPRYVDEEDVVLHLRKYCVSQQKRIINALLRMATLVRKPFYSVMKKSASANLK